MQDMKQSTWNIPQNKERIWITCSYGRVLLPPPYASHFIHLESWGYFSLWSTAGVLIKKIPALALDLPPNKGRARVTRVNAMRFTTMSVVTFGTSNPYSTVCHLMFALFNTWDAVTYHEQIISSDHCNLPLILWIILNAWLLQRNDIRGKEKKQKSITGSFFHCRFKPFHFHPYSIK